MADGIYVRDFTAYGVTPIDLNKIIAVEDYSLYVENEYENISQKYPGVDNENNIHPDVVIVSDGYGFNERQKILASLPKNIAIIGVNGALKKWQMVGEQAELKRAMNYYVVNNPYNECLNFLPNNHRYYPKCISSTRTNPKFLREYQGLKFLFAPTENENFSGLKLRQNYQIDDYRNPICAALNLAYQFKSRRILLFCCDDAFADERPGAIQLENRLWSYPQQLKSHKVIDAMCYWLNHKKISVADFSNSGKYDYASYISEEKDVMRYFGNE